MTTPYTSAVLRDVAFHAQPRALGRRPTAVSEPSSVVVSIASATPAKPDLVASAEQQGHALGLARGEREGHDAGFAEGMRDARRDIDEAVRQALAKVEADAARDQLAHTSSLQAIADRLEQLVTGFAAAAEARLASLQDDAIALAYEAVCRCVGNITASRDHVASIAVHAIDSSHCGALKSVRLHPDDLHALQGDATGLALMAKHPAVAWLADPGVDPGGCVLDAERGSVDARMGTQLERLRALWAATLPLAGRQPAAEGLAR